MVSLVLACAAAQAEVSWALRARADGGYAFSSIAVDTESMERPADAPSTHGVQALHLGAMMRFDNPRTRNYFAGAWQGLGVGLLNFGPTRHGDGRSAAGYIGRPIMVYAMQGAPMWHITDRLSLEYEWNFGVSVGWHAYSPGNKLFNLTSGTGANAVIDLGARLSYRLSPAVSLTAGVGVAHYSNGNTSWPNPGVNTLSARVGVTCSPWGNPTPPPALPDTVRGRIVWDLTVWAAPRRRVYKEVDPPVLMPGRFMTAGLSVAPMWHCRHWLRAGGGVDLQWDESGDMERNRTPESPDSHPQFYRPAFSQQLSLGIAAHAELVMPVFTVGLACGLNLVAPPEDRGTYQYLALKTYLARWLYLNVGYQLRNLSTQSNLMLGLGCTI